MQKQRRFRSKPSAAADEDEGAGAPAVLVAARKSDKDRKDRQQERRKADVVKKASLLSFEDDEEGAASAPAPMRTVRAQAAALPREKRAAPTQRSAPGAALGRRACAAVQYLYSASTDACVVLKLACCEMRCSRQLP